MHIRREGPHFVAIQRLQKVCQLLARLLRERERKKERKKETERERERQRERERECVCVWEKMCV